MNVNSKTQTFDYHITKKREAYAQQLMEHYEVVGKIIDKYSTKQGAINVKSIDNQALASYTNLNTINNIENSLYPIKTFKNAAILLSDRNFDIDSLKEHLHDAFYEFYITKGIIPSHKLLEARYQIDLNNLAPIQKLIEKKFVVYEHAPKYSSHIVYEHPRLIYERTVYLKKMQKYRSEKKHFTYIDVTISVKGDCKAATPYDGEIFSKVIMPNFLNDIKYIHNVLGSLVHDLNKETVIVLSINKKRQEINEFSEKKAMKEWLAKREIPFNEKDHSAVLYKLIKMFQKKYKDTGSVVQDVLESYGFEVVAVPHGYKQLNYFNQNVVKTEEVIIDGDQEQVTEQEEKNWIEMDQELDKNEKIMYQKDREMEDFTEKFLITFKNGGLDDTDFHYSWTGSKQDAFFAKISDIVKN